MENFVKKIKFSFDENSKALQKYLKRKYNISPENQRNILARVNVYQTPKDKIFSSKPLNIKSGTKEIISVSLQNKLVKLKKQGLYFGIEIIGLANSNYNNDSRIRLRPQLTGKTSEFYDATTYIRNVFADKKLTPLKDLLNFKGKDFKRNLNLSITVFE
ncbi:hypothetical protein [Haloflavibacter putidus]|uniref:Uncharacterized protein n=1 Tax=Haloflavibacter putidus TaxID=2576776 RepID=A0A507ZSR0_9FLAO|nr:hypothetical protein [Haloflavibacter putidus]TQD39284.1 hypothetical protein FKR84_05135 [Haloflavibacter putidus]